MILVSSSVWCSTLVVDPSKDTAGWKLQKFSEYSDTGDTSGTTATWNTCEGPNKSNALQIKYNFETKGRSTSSTRYQIALTRPVDLDLSQYSWFSIWIKGCGYQYFLFVDFIDGSGRQWRMGSFSVADKTWRKYECTFNAPSRTESDPGFNRSDIKSIRIYLDEAGGLDWLKAWSGNIAIGDITLSNDGRVRLVDDNLACLTKWAKTLKLPSKSAVTALSKKWKSTADLQAAEVQTLTLKNQLLQEAAFKLSGLSQDAVKYCVGIEKPINKLTPDPYRFLGDLGSEMHLSAAGREYESGKLALISLGQQVNGVKVKIAGNLSGPDNNIIPASMVDVRLGSFVNCTATTWAYYDYIGEMEDPLLKNAAFDLLPGRVQPVWVTVNVPAGTPKGSYCGEIQITTANAHPWKVRLVVDVKGFTLSVEHHVARHFYYWPGNICKWYDYPGGINAWFGPEGVPEDIMKRHLAMLLSYRIDPIGPFMKSVNVWGSSPEPAWPLKVVDGQLNFDKFDEILNFCEKRGLSSLIIGDLTAQPLSTAPHWPVAKNYLSQLLAHLKKIGWFERTIVKLVDEPGLKHHSIVEDQADCLHSVDPRLKTLVCAPDTKPGLGKYVNIWLPRIPDLTPEDTVMMRKEGAEIGWYVCCIPFHHPEVNYWVNYPGLDQRILEWMHWKIGIKHNLLWGVNVWDGNYKTTGEIKWPEIPWNTHSYADYNEDGNLTYPSSDGDLLASVRLELIRDGAEDYEYLYMLDDITKQIQSRKLSGSFVSKARKALRIDSIVTDPRNYNTDPSALMRYRDRLGSLIEKGLEILRQGSKA